MDKEEVIRRAPQVRKMLWWIFPFFCGMVIFSCYITISGIVAPFEELRQSAPSVQIGPAALVAPLLGGACAVCLFLGPLRAIPYTGVWSNRLEWLMNGFIFACVPVMLFIGFGSTPLQNHYMPKLGYTKCTLLEGNPTIWFTDWVKNSDWCVRGKSRAWVHEQAGAPPPKS